jgi:hypothetical protein
MTRFPGIYGRLETPNAMEYLPFACSAAYSKLPRGLSLERKYTKGPSSEIAKILMASRALMNDKYSDDPFWFPKVTASPRRYWSPFSLPDIGALGTPRGEHNNPRGDVISAAGAAKIWQLVAANTEVVSA